MAEFEAPKFIRGTSNWRLWMIINNNQLLVNAFLSVKLRLALQVLFKMAEIPITGLEELEDHLQELLRAPETPLNAVLFDEVELQLTGMLIKISIRASDKLPQAHVRAVTSI